MEIHVKALDFQQEHWNALPAGLIHKNAPRSQSCSLMMLLSLEQEREELQQQYRLREWAQKLLWLKRLTGLGGRQPLLPFLLWMKAVMLDHRAYTKSLLIK